MTKIFCQRLLSTNNKLSLFFCCLLFSSIAISDDELLPEQALRVLTEATPFTVLKPDGQPGGEATILVNAILDRAGIKYNTSYIPWKRSYQYAQNQSDILIYPIARTDHRENEFIWVGRIIPVRYFLFKLKSRSDINLTNLEHAKQYSIGVVNKHVHHEYLIDKSFTNLQLVNNSAQNLRKLLLGRIDMFPMSSGGLEPLCSELKVDCAEIVPAIALEPFSQGLYIALSKNSNPQLLERIRTAYDIQILQEDSARLFEYRIQASEKFESAQ